MIKYKRLKVLGATLIIFTIGICFRIDPISLGTGLGLITAAYYAGETIRKSDGKDKVQ